MKKLIALGFSLFIATGLCAQTSSITILTPDAISNLVTRVVKAGANVTISTNTNTFVLTITATGGGGGGSGSQTPWTNLIDGAGNILSNVIATNIDGKGITNLQGSNVIGSINSNSLPTNVMFLSGANQILIQVPVFQAGFNFGDATKMPAGSAKNSTWFLAGNAAEAVVANAGVDYGFQLVSMNPFARETWSLGFVTTNATIFNGGGGSGTILTNSAGVVIGYVLNRGSFVMENDPGLLVNMPGVANIVNNGNNIALSSSGNYANGVTGDYPYFYSQGNVSPYGWGTPQWNQVGIFTNIYANSISNVAVPDGFWSFHVDPKTGVASNSSDYQVGAILYAGSTKAQLTLASGKINVGAFDSTQAADMDISAARIKAQRIQIPARTTITAPALDLVGNGTGFFVTNDFDITVIRAGVQIGHWGATSLDLQVTNFSASNIVVTNNAIVKGSIYTPTNNLSTVSNVVTAGDFSNILASSSVFGTSKVDGLTVIASAGVLSVGAIITTNNASQLSSGTVTDGRLSSNIPLKNGANAFSITGNSFAGTTTFSDTTNTATLSVSGTALLNSNLTVGDTTSSTGARLVVIQNGTTVAMFINTNAASSSSGGGMSGFAGTTPTGADQRLGFLAFGITDKVTATNSVAITGFSSQIWTNGSAQGSYIALETTANGSTVRRQVGRISQDGVIISTNGFASNNTNQYVIASTGWTNTNSFSCTALITATAATATLSDGTNTVHTYTTITGELSIPMHPSYKITAASGLSGVAISTQ